MIQKHLWISGIVQGVGFRASTLKAASRFPDLRGFVKNLADGRVEAVFSGTESSVTQMVEWCRRGPPSARVTQLEVQTEEIDSNLGPFQMVRFG